MMLRHAMVIGTMSMGLVTGGTAYAADQTLTGLVTVVDRTTSEIIIKQDVPKQGTSSDTVGSAARAETTKFKMRDAVPESLHAGEKVTVTYTESGGVNTATKVEESKD